MLCDHCGDCYELLTDVRVLNTLANLLDGVNIWLFKRGYKIKT